MKLSLVLLVVALAGVVGGAALIARWAVGLAIIVDSLAVALFALGRDVPEEKRDEPTVTTVEEILRREARLP